MVAQRLVSLLVGAFIASSCFIPIHEDGTVTFAWSIGNEADRTTCSDRRASVVHIVVVEQPNDVHQQADGVVVIADAPCDAFRSRFLLDHGWYDATLTLVDTSHGAVSETRQAYPFYVAPHLDTFVPVAFDAANPPL